MYLILSPSDIYFLTGVHVHDPGEVFLLLYSGNISENAHEWMVFCDARTSALFDSQKYEIIDDRASWKEKLSQFHTLATDPDFLTQTLREKVEGYGIQLTMNKSPVTEERIIKTPWEIQKLRESQRLNKLVYQKILPHLRIWSTEEEIARKIQMLQLELGASGPSFPPIVAFEENSAIPHHSPTQRKLLPEDIILLDMWLICQWYCSDMTRMVYQDNISEEAHKIWQMVTSVTQEIIHWAKPGMKMSELDKKARELLGEYESYFTHSLGHGVGIDIHEAPHVSGKSDETLTPWMIITIEPGIYIAGKYGARYEEMCVVSEKWLEVL